jgi:hypothetical protein
MTRWATRWLVLARWPRRVRRPGGSVDQAPATGLDLKLASSSRRSARCCSRCTVTLDLYVAPDSTSSSRRRSTPRTSAPKAVATSTAARRPVASHRRWLRPRAWSRRAGGAVVPRRDQGRRAGGEHARAEDAGGRRSVAEPAAALEGAGATGPSASRSSHRGTGGRRRWVVAGRSLSLVLLGLWPPRRAGDADGRAVPPHVQGAARAAAAARGSSRTTEAEIETFYVEHLGGAARLPRGALRAARARAHDRGVPARLEGGDALATAHRAELERFLRQCDLVKFAAVRPGENEHLATWRWRRRSSRRRGSRVTAPVPREAPVAGFAMIAVLELGCVTLLDPWFLLADSGGALAVLWRGAAPRAALPTAAVHAVRGRRAHLAAASGLVAAAGKLLAAVCARGRAGAAGRTARWLPLREQGIDIVLVRRHQLVDGDPRHARRRTLRRMDAARERAEEFAAARTHDRVALVTFARYPSCAARRRSTSGRWARSCAWSTRCRRTVRSTAPPSAPRSRKPCRCCRRAAKSKRRRAADRRREHRPGHHARRRRIKLAMDAGVRVHTIGLGNGNPTPFGRMRPLDFKDLRKIAERTGGAFFQPKGDEELADVYARIDALETHRDRGPALPHRRSLRVAARPRAVAAGGVAARRGAAVPEGAVNDLEWGRGWLWPALLAMPLLWALVHALFDRTRQALRRYGAATRRGSGGPLLRSLRLCVLLLLGLLCWMDPRSGEETVTLERRGLDVIVCLDTSRSMLAGDMEPSRLQRAMQDVRALLPALAGRRPHGARGVRR